MGKGLVDEFRDEFNIEDEWLPYELQPGTPPEGRLLTDKFRPHEITAMFKNLRQRGDRYGMVFNDRDRASNSKLALLAGEFARDSGRFEEFHENVFRAFFTDLKDIGQPDVILEIASDSGLNPEKLRLAFSEGRHRDRLYTAAAEARRLGIRSIPAFIFENDEIVLGASSPEIFRKTLEGIRNGTYVNPII
ncbi:DsbA family protein [Desulfococcaceae bacterium HSG8]|nr:DsbA family protein [Desulfococcaceae bacterium HSG8]